MKQIKQPNEEHMLLKPDTSITSTTDTVYDAQSFYFKSEHLYNAKVAQKRYVAHSLFD